METGIVEPEGDGRGFASKIVPMPPVVYDLMKRGEEFLMAPLDGTNRSALGQPHTQKAFPSAVFEALINETTATYNDLCALASTCRGNTLAWRANISTCLFQFLEMVRDDETGYEAMVRAYFFAPMGGTLLGRFETIAVNMVARDADDHQLRFFFTRPGHLHCTVKIPFSYETLFVTDMVHSLAQGGELTGLCEFVYGSPTPPNLHNMVGNFRFPLVGTDTFHSLVHLNELRWYYGRWVPYGRSKRKDKKRPRVP